MKTEEKKSKFVMFWKKLFGRASDMLYPENIKCVFCGNDVPDFEHKMFCDECEKNLPFNNKHKCAICDEPISSEAIVCDICQKSKRFFKKAFCPFVYEDKVRTAILGYKDSNHRYMAKPFAKFISDEILKSGTKIDVVTFVPLAAKKKKKRGFDQSELLAREIAERLGVPCKCYFEKVKDGKTQKLLEGYKERIENTKEMYKIASGNRFSKKLRVLVVDDIITTGSTINACCKLIYKRVDSVYAAAVARNQLGKKKKRAK